MGIIQIVSNLIPFLWWPLAANSLMTCSSAVWIDPVSISVRGREGEKKSSGSRVGMIYDYCKGSEARKSDIHLALVEVRR